jgi:hypothetical protein
MSEQITRKLYITDLKLGLTFFGEVQSLLNLKNTISVTLINVNVYEYSSSNYLYSIPEISLAGPPARFHFEEASI